MEHRRWRLPSALCAVLLAGCTGSGSAAGLAAAAADFTAPPGWQELERSTRSGGGCIDVECPRAVVRWDAPGAPTAPDITARMRAAGWSDVTVDGSCEPTAGRTGAFPLCTATASAQDGIRVRLAVSGASAGASVTLEVTRP